MNDDAPLKLGALLFPGVDQMDFTGPFEVLCRLPHSTFHLVAKDRAPITDAHGLVLHPQLDFAACPDLDVLIVPGGRGVDAVIEDALTVEFVRRQAVGARLVMTVCTGAFLLAATGLLRGRRATTHWASHHLLGLTGAVPVDERVVEDGNLISTAGVTAGFDGSLRAAARLRGEEAARQIQLEIEYDPDPPFRSGHPTKAAAKTVDALKAQSKPYIDRRTAVIQRLSSRLSIRP